MPATATTEAVEQKLYASLVELGVNPDQLLAEARWEELDIDSLDLVELVQVIEEEFGVELTREDIKHVPTVGSVTDLVVTRARST
jgi:acyl carrier protein